jgi:hypothetical protein
MPTALVIADTPIRQDAEGRFSLNDLHKASGEASRDQPSKWLILDQTTALIAAIDADTGNLVSEQIQPVKVHKGGNSRQGTFVVKELVYAYAMWISPAFHLQVIRAYDTLVSKPQPFLRFGALIMGAIIPFQFDARLFALWSMITARCGSSARTLPRFWATRIRSMRRSSIAVGW